MPYGLLQQPDLSAADKLIKIMGWLALIFLWGLVLFYYSALPDTIPIHYSGGEADGYGSKSTLFMLPALATAIFLGFTLLAKVIRAEQINPPPRTPEIGVKQLALVRRMLGVINLAMILIFILLVFQTTPITGRNTQTLAWWFAPLAFALIFIPPIFFIAKLLKNNRD